MSAQPLYDIDQPEAALRPTLETLKSAFLTIPNPSAGMRIERLQRLHTALLAYQDRLIDAVDQDFNGRSNAETLMIELLPILEGIHYNKKNLRKWMKPSRRKTPLMLFGAKTKVHYQPLGVVGIVVPWNFPIFLGLSPLAGALAAGNLAMIKTSEFAPKTGEVMKQMISEYFTSDEVVVVNGGVEVATEFTKLPFDHIVFTGSTQVGSIVMQAAAQNLTPVTLELGGKSPAIIHEDFPIEEAAKRIAFGKGLNAGQVCVSPDYILVPNGKVDEFAEAFKNTISKHYPTMRDNPDYTSIITERQRDRLADNIADAKQKGAEVMVINPANEDFSGTRKLPMHVVKNVTHDMRVMREEIFGPILPLVPYETLDDAIQYVQSKDRPLALYYFDWDQSRVEKVVENTHSGGVCINEVMTHTMVDDMPFGGVGPSGMGHYHGKEGFLNFSKAKSIVIKGRFDASQYISAPWGNKMFNFFTNFQLNRLKKF